ncbi:MAG: addiction module protein [Pseudomonadales bacterium]
MDLPDIDKLSFEEKRRLVEKLLESMSAETAEPAPEWHLELARECLAEYERTGERGEPAREAIERIFRNF